MGFLFILLAICGFVGWIWTVVAAFQAGDTVWGICCLLPIVAFIYCILHFDELKVPFGLLCASLVGRIGLVVLAAVQGS
jgi:hypothetical protein